MLDTIWRRGSPFGNSPVNFIFDHFSSTLPVRIVPHAEDYRITPPIKSALQVHGTLKCQDRKGVSKVALF